MQIMHKREAGLDVHKATVVACVRLMTGRELTECRCTHVAMEATGVYWTPVWKILSDGDFTLIPAFAGTANAAHVKNVPGRKTDMNDAMWIAECGRRLSAH